MDRPNRKTTQTLTITLKLKSIWTVMVFLITFILNIRKCWLNRWPSWEWWYVYNWFGNSSSWILLMSVVSVSWAESHYLLRFACLFQLYIKCSMDMLFRCHTCCIQKHNTVLRMLVQSSVHINEKTHTHKLNQASNLDISIAAYLDTLWKSFFPQIGQLSVFSSFSCN